MPTPRRKTGRWPPGRRPGTGRGQAAADGVIDAAEAKAESVIRDADLIVLAGPATACLPLIDRLAGRWRKIIRPDAIVTDVASTKAAIVERADATGLWFVGGHPMAGRENVGYEASDAELFVDRPWVLVPGALAGQNDIERVTELADGMPGRCRPDGWARPTIVLSPRSAICRSSWPRRSSRPSPSGPATPSLGRRHAPSGRSPPALAAGGWRDTTRVARGDPAMGAAIAVTNAAELGARLRDLRGVLDAWQAELDRPDGPDEKTATARLAAAKAILEKSRVSDEHVFVVPRDAVIDEAGWYGLRTDGLDAFVAALERDGRYEPRDRMEQDPAFKQVIPYLVLRDGERYFLMQRTAAGGDARLHGRYSIGVGGHLNPGDGGLLGGLRREWDEELVADFVPEFRLVALLNDDTTEVGAVHLGAVYVADAGGRPVDIRETDKLSGSFVEARAVEAVADRLETWSRLVFESFVGSPAGSVAGS